MLLVSDLKTLLNNFDDSAEVKSVVHRANGLKEQDLYVKEYKGDCYISFSDFDLNELVNQQNEREDEEIIKLEERLKKLQDDKDNRK